MYAATHMFESGDGKIGKELYKIREALSEEPNIVDEDNMETFHEQIKRSISDKMIAALSKYCKIAKTKHSTTMSQAS